MTKVVQMDERPKTRSRLLILSHIAQFSLGGEIGGQPYCGLKDMRFREAQHPPIGSLVAPHSSPPSKWYLSWVHEVKVNEHGYFIYTLESIEDGELCDWSNVSLWAYDRSQTYQHPEWRWTDKQHEFYDRWRKVCYGERDAYIVLPVQPVFYDDGAVTLTTRTRFSMDSIRPERRFESWRKVTKKMMIEFYDDAVRERDALAGKGAA
jgi:hypothetical protein